MARRSILRSAMMAAVTAGAVSLTMAGIASAQGDGYDPRTWVYDGEQDVVIAPSDDAGRDVVDEPATGPVRLPTTRRVPPIARKVVAFAEPHPKGSIIVDTGERRLYYVLGDGRALKYAIGVGREGFSWSGRDRILDKKEWPDWRPPAEMREREAAQGHDLPVRMAGGPNNPLGARALYIGNTLYRIHGTNAPWTVGTANSSGCIRMTNDDVIDLYRRASIGAEVVVR
ncbi:L,D-transpeptidase [Labrys sp. KNU-23]|uniref:L,D-transpeptidase n=1 Tax=Labrys sp. KNU-23 TaxID=2789216 RepID=UPI001FEF1A82|nr:L,D-transpeptidase [Labrys sp. KNU-23]